MSDKNSYLIGAAMVVGGFCLMVANFYTMKNASVDSILLLAIGSGGGWLGKHLLS